MNKITLIFMIFIFILVLKNYNRTSNNSDNNNDSDSNNNNAPYYKNNQQYNYLNYPKALEKINFLVLDTPLGNIGEGKRDILFGSYDASERFFNQKTPFSEKEGLNIFHYSPETIWNLILSGLQKNINVSGLVSTRSYNQPIILKNSTLSNFSASGAESVLTKELSRYLDPSFSTLLFPNFSHPNTKDNLIFLINTLGKTYKPLYSNRNSELFLDNSILDTKITLTGKLQDYESIKNHIQLIYEKLSQLIESNTDIPQDKKPLEIANLYNWYEKNSYYIELFIKNLSTPGYKLNIAFSEFISFNTYNTYLNIFIPYSYLPVEIIDENGNNIYPTAVTKIHGGHFGTEIINKNKVCTDSTFIPQIDWILSNYYKQQ
ncbi:hypothetical protein DICPUDRAFT_77160 [Dictyostelium purpureum]|uniref:Uncharacterized protein n=1 Tax=Dictyostelium purpureum TaxID=5786 RepID=F0ZFS6_DICPU|nr:uncharacterized protein DICPUDRAFT_77160 [Dictyostelium purpureum]EGC37207.1 hypothetical protein DICPUDRAFT_77160 [Dictyostelium purpureum]|eukprot:XP_003286258.1 hypothetical protein DICPUDRAFT_77160 [Dictyostelium purpureum]